MKIAIFGNQTLKETLSTILLLLVAGLLLFFRNPLIFLHPEPWVEDMLIFLPHEYMFGFPETAFFLYQGYIHLLPRIIACISMKFDPLNVMIVMNLTVLLFKVMICYLIYRSKEISSVLIKISLIAYLILVPFCDEIYNNVTDLQWWLILLMALIIIKRETNAFVFMFDIYLLILAGLTGINSILFAVPCAYLAFRAADRDIKIKSVIVIVCGCIQLCCLLSTPRVGKIMYNGGGLDIIHMFVNRIIYHTLFNFDSKNYINILVFFLYISALIFNLYYYRKQLTVHFIFLFSAIYTVAIFYNLMRQQFGPFSNDIQGFGSERYFVFLRICSFILLISTLSIIFKSLLSPKNFRMLRAYLFLILGLVLLAHYHINDYYTANYYADIQKFKAAKTGEIVKIHYAPTWLNGASIDLMKK